jgi:hypothetical protein
MGVAPGRARAKQVLEFPRLAPPAPGESNWRASETGEDDFGSGIDFAPKPTADRGAHHVHVSLCG